MSESETPLLPCPFCGETPDVNNPHTFQSNQGDKWGYVVCCCCGPEVRTGYGPVETWRDDAIAAWNRRATGLGGGQDGAEKREPNEQVAAQALDAERYKTVRSMNPADLEALAWEPENDAEFDAIVDAARKCP